MMISQLDDVVTRDQREIPNVNQRDRMGMLANPGQPRKAGLDPEQEGSVSITKSAGRKLGKQEIIGRVRRDGVQPLRRRGGGR